MKQSTQVNLPKGFSIQVNGGTKYAGFYVRFRKLSWRLCLGWLAFSVFFYDVEPAISNMVKSLKGKK